MTMFRKILVANRGEIAVRIIQTCREMGIQTLALYEAQDRESLHVRGADEAVLLDVPGGFTNQQAILDIAKAHGADAIHPGYGFLAEESSFIRACQAANITFVGPPEGVVHTLRNKVNALKQVHDAGFPTVLHTAASFGSDELAALTMAAAEIGYPLIVKSVVGGRGPGARLVRRASAFDEAVRRAQQEAQTVYGDHRLYLEKAILPAHQIGVQILADAHGAMITLGDREGSLQFGNRKVIEEAPSPSLNETQRQQINTTALEIARLFRFENAGTVEFILDDEGRHYFTEIKARIQIEAPLSEMLTRVDLIRYQILVAAGEPLDLAQEDVIAQGWAMMARVSAEDPWNRSLTSPGQLRRVRWPVGQEVRVDTYVYSAAFVPEAYDPLIANVTVWGQNRERCLARMRRALEDSVLIGTPTNLPVLQRIVSEPEFAKGDYNTGMLDQSASLARDSKSYRRDMAIAAAVFFARRYQAYRPVLPERLNTAWHRSSRRLPE